MLIQLLLALFIKIVLGDNVLRINNANEFIDFSKNVDSGTNYSGTTVYLDSDLSLSGETIRPIGKDDRNNYFSGVFDGQGHIISDLKISTTSQFTGLFSYSEGMTTRNVVLDSSCSVTCNFTGNENVRVGGIIGWCYAYSEGCNIENSVNMADVTFSGNTSGDSGLLFLGGVSGSLRTSSSYPVYVKNCANYGTVTHSGIVSGLSYIGGIVGDLDGSNYTYFYNCLNYGTLTHNGTSSNALRLGGIVGYSRYAYIENCVNAGEISAPTKASESYIGGIVGHVYSGTNITHCYYTNDVDVNKLYGYAIPTPAITETPTSPSTVNSTLIAKLNNYATEKTWNKWLFNKNNASISFVINYGKGFTVNSQIVLLPDLANSSEHNFSGWYTDADLATLFNLSQVDSDITLYGMFCEPSNYTVTLDANGGNELDENEMTVGCMNYYGTFPTPTKEGYAFLGWFTEREGGGDKVESGDKVKTLNNHTLYAHWVINNYTVTFDVNGGNNLDNYTITVTFNSSYGSLPTPTKEGYMLIGWFTDNNVNVTNETIVSIADNHTLHAHWKKVTNYVEIVFNTKDLSREDVEEIVKKYTGAEFTITGFEEEPGEIRVIIKFTDDEEAVTFIRNVNELSRDGGSSMIKRVGFALGSDGSFSSFLYPKLLALLI